MQSVGGSIDTGHLLGKRLGRAIRGGRVEGRKFVLRGMHRRAKHLGARGVEKLGRIGQVTDDLKQAQGRHTDAIDGGFRQFQAQTRTGLARQMVKLRGLRPADDAPEVGRILKSAVVQKQSLVQQGGVGHQMADVAGGETIGPMHETMHRVSLPQQQLGEVGTVLPGDTGDKGNF